MKTTVEYTHGRSGVEVAVYNDGVQDAMRGSMGYDYSQDWTLAEIEADLQKQHPNQTIVIIAAY